MPLSANCPLAANVPVVKIALAAFGLQVALRNELVPSVSLVANVSAAALRLRLVAPIVSGSPARTHSSTSARRHGRRLVKWLRFMDCFPRADYRPTALADNRRST